MTDLEERVCQWRETELKGMRFEEIVHVFALYETRDYKKSRRYCSASEETQNVDPYLRNPHLLGILKETRGVILFDWRDLSPGSATIYGWCGLLRKRPEFTKYLIGEEVWQADEGSK